MFARQGRKIGWWPGVRRISSWGIVLVWLFSFPSLGEEVEVIPEVEVTREVEVPPLADVTPEVKEATLEMDGDLISLNFQDADIREVLRLISTHAEVNIVPDVEVTGEVTIALREVSWERALETILRMQGLVSIREENIIRVTTVERFRVEEEREREEEERRREREEEEWKEEERRREREELKTRTFSLNFAQAEEIKESIAGALSERGEVIVNERMNALLITDTPARLANIEEIMRGLDTRVVQVTIEAKLIEVILREGEDLGIDWNIVGGIERGATRPTTFPFEADRGLGDFAPAPGEDFAPGEHFPLLGADDFLFGVLSAETFRAVLHLLETQAETRILSAPNITTLSNEEANIFIGDQHPVPTFEHVEERLAVTGFELIDIGIGLTVTPRVRPGGAIIMDVKPKVSDSFDTVTFMGVEVPIISTREANTRVMVRDGETLVIGGLMTTEEREMVTRVPLLGALPILGGLFRKTAKEEVKTDLLIFVTASIVKEPVLLSDHQRLRLEEIEASR